MRRILFGAFTGAMFTSVYTLVLFGVYCASMLYITGKTDLVPYYEVPSIWIATAGGGALLGALMVGVEKPQTGVLDISRVIMLAALWLAGHGVMVYIAWPNQEAVLAIGVLAWVTGVIGLMIRYHEKMRANEAETPLPEETEFL